MAGLAPGLTSDLLHLVQRLALPRPAGTGPDGTGPDGDEATPGSPLDPAMSRKAFDRLTVLGRAAASRFNERRAAGQT